MIGLTMTDDTLLSLAGIYLTSMSIILLYNIFKLQNWVDQINDIGNSLEKQPPQGKAKRKDRDDLDNQLKIIRKDLKFLVFPLAITLLLGILGIMPVLLITDETIKKLASIPFISLLILIIIFNGYFIYTYMNRLNEFQGKINEWNKE